MAALRIGVNALYLIPGAVGGTEIYLRNLLAALARLDSGDQFVGFTNRETGDGLTPAAAGFRTAPQAVSARNRPARILWEQIRLPAAVRRERIDVLFNPGFTAPAWCGRPTVTVFHDLQHQRHPEYFRWFDLPFWRLFLFQSAHTATALIAVSEATRRDLLRFYRLPAARIHVIRHGVEESFFAIARERQGRAPRPFLLCVSTLHPHKNLERLLRVFARFRERHPETALVLAGMRGFHTRAIEELIRQLRLGGAVRLTGWIGREELRALYRDARAFLYPSTFEGFGLPVLEALAAGVPTACSAIPPLQEVAGDAALLFDPLDEAAMLAAMEQVAGDEELRRQLSRAGPERARRFSWRAAATETLSILRSVAGPAEGLPVHRSKSSN